MSASTLQERGHRIFSILSSSEYVHESQENMLNCKRSDPFLAHKF
jgi:hypothetical protein